jgi:hypothetical protein
MGKDKDAIASSERKQQLSYLNLSMEIKCFPSRPDNAEMDMARFAQPFLTKISAARRIDGWFANRRDANMVLMLRLRMEWNESMHRARQVKLHQSKQQIFLQVIFQLSNSDLLPRTAKDE